MDGSEAPQPLTPEIAAVSLSPAPKGFGIQS